VKSPRTALWLAQHFDSRGWDLTLGGKETSVTTDSLDVALEDEEQLDEVAILTVVMIAAASD
jgi:hypothetical protein